MSYSAENGNRDVTVSHAASRAFATFGARLSLSLTLARLVRDDETIHVVPHERCLLAGRQLISRNRFIESNISGALSVICIDGRNHDCLSMFAKRGQLFMGRPRPAGARPSPRARAAAINCPASCGLALILELPRSVRSRGSPAALMHSPLMGTTANYIVRLLVIW